MCHTIAMDIALSANKAVEAFNADYYLAIVTILPILMIALEVLTNFNKSVPVEITESWPSPLYYLIYSFYLFSPAIAACGVIVGVLALMYREPNAIEQWTAFACLISVLVFLATSSSIYLFAFNKTEVQLETKAAAKRSAGNSDTMIE